MTRLSVVVPCYNERESIPQLVDRLEGVHVQLGFGYELECIFVDDGSLDGTAQQLEEACHNRLRAKIIRHMKNQGLGAALRTGFASATGELIATADSDCTYDPQELIPMLRLLEEGADVVVGSAYHPRGSVLNVPPYRLFLSRNLSRFYNLVLGTNIYTYTSLLRLSRAEVIRAVRAPSDDFLAVAQMLVEALLLGYRVAEHPMTLSARTFGRSKAVILRLMKDHALFLSWLVWHRVRVAPQAIGIPAQRAVDHAVE